MRLNHTAMTLTELLVATALIGIVIIGVLSVEYAVRSADQSTSAGAIVSMKAGTIMQDIYKNASLATGNQPDPGIRDLTTSFYELCFRQDRNTPPTPNTYLDDVWKCYAYGAEPITLESCVVSAVPNGDLTACRASVDYNILDNNVVSFTGTFVHNPTTPGSAFAIEVSMTVRKNASLAADPYTNPEIALTTRVSPISHSW